MCRVALMTSDARIRPADTYLDDLAGPGPGDLDTLDTVDDLDDLAGPYPDDGNDHVDPITDRPTFGTAVIDPIDLTVNLRAWTKPQPQQEVAGATSTDPARTPDNAPATRVRRRGRTGWTKTTKVGWALVFDTETTIDAAQQLNFGVWRLVYRHPGGRVDIAEEGLFHADNLPTRDPAGYAVLIEHVRTRRADVTPGEVGPVGRAGARLTSSETLTLLSRHDWVEQILWQALQLGAVVVGFNLPFDLSRVAVDAGPAQGDNYGAFSLKLWDVDGYRPRIIIRHLDSRKSLISAGSLTRNPPGWRPPRFLDLRTLTSAITDRGFGLKSACEHWQVDNGKTDPGEHGTITDTYVEYCRRDVQATGELLGKVLTDFYSYRVPDLDPCRALSGASLAKATLRGLGIVPPLDSNPDFPVDMLGASMEAFYGGRSEVRTRRVHVPAQIHDFTSMYPTVNTLTGLWGMLTADTITADDATDGVRDLLDRVTVEDCYRPDTWRDLVGVAQILADGDVLPVRASFERGRSPVIGLQPVYSNKPTWYTIADLVTSKILTGRVPTIVRAVRFTGHGKADTLKPSTLSSLKVDPTIGDMFQLVIEKRKSPGTDESTSRFLKLFANSGSYGIFSEFTMKPYAVENVQVMDVTTGDSRFEHSGTVTEEPGAWCFPPIATTITGAARLMLALLEQAVLDSGGWWAFCDTDSMAIICNNDGSLIPCPGGPYRDGENRECVRALTPAQTATIRERFDTELNPYNRDTIPHLLKHEYSATVYAVSAKRYATYTLNDSGRVDHVTDNEGKTVSLGKQHGVGYLLPPTMDRDDPECPLDLTDRDWIDALWRTVIERDLGLPETDRQIRGWDELAALTRLTVTSPYLLNLVRRLNDGKEWSEQVKPFNFLNMLTGDATLHSSSALVAPYSVDTRNVSDREWFSLHDGTIQRIRYGAYNPDVDVDYRQGIITDLSPTVHVKDFGHIVARHDRSCENKYRAPDGTPCIDDTRGLLLRIPIRIAHHRYVGKEMPTLDETEQITGAWAHTVLGEDNSEWIETLDVLKVIGVRAIRVELDRTGYRHKEFESPNWCPESDWRLHRNADYYRHKIDTATTTRVRAQWADRLAAFEESRKRAHRELDLTEPRISDSQLHRILKEENRPGANVRRRLIRLARDHKQNIETRAENLRRGSTS